MRDFYTIIVTMFVTGFITLLVMIPNTRGAWESVKDRTTFDKNSVVYTTLDSALTRDEVIALGLVASRQSKGTFYYIIPGE